jgi:hypothetical protein
MNGGELQATVMKFVVVRASGWKVLVFWFPNNFVLSVILINTTLHKKNLDSFLPTSFKFNPRLFYNNFKKSVWSFSFS